MQTSTFPMSRLPRELICEVLLCLSGLEPPTDMKPMGWLTQALGVCRLWRQCALHCPELWAHNAGSFLSHRLTSFALDRARALPLRFNGQLEDGIGPDLVLPDWQMSFVDGNLSRISVLIHNDYRDWSALASLPRLEEATFWDDSEPGAWNEVEVDAPVLTRLCLNNSLIPFNAPKLTHLRLESQDSTYWQITTLALISFLQRSPQLESLWMSESPSRSDSAKLPSPHEFRADLSQLRHLHLEGYLRDVSNIRKRLGISTSHGDLRLHIICREDYPDSEEEEVDYESTWRFASMACCVGLRHLLQMCCLEVIASEERFVLKSWPCWVNDVWVGESMGLPLRDMHSAPMLLLELPYPKPPSKRVLTRFSDFLNQTSWAVACVPNYGILHFDLTDAPKIEEYDESLTYDGLQLLTVQIMHMSLSYERHHHLLGFVLDFFDWNPLEPECGVTLVDFPCATFPCAKRYDREFNDQAWETVIAVFKKRAEDIERGWRCADNGSLLEKKDPLILRLAESTSTLTEWDRWDQLGEYKHTITDTYEKAVAAANANGYRDIASLVSRLEDLRVNSWPYPTLKYGDNEDLK